MKEERPMGTTKAVPMDCDVLVAGGGTAGVVAAVQAARAGARTLLVERTGQLGGTITNAAINFPGGFHADGRQIIAGIGWDLVSATLRECGDPMPDPATQKPGLALHGLLNPFVFSALADEFVRDAGVHLLLHAMPATVQAREGGWDVAVATKTGLCHVMAGVLVDCTGDANLAILAGLPVTRSAELQACTPFVTFDGYDPAALDIAAIQRAYDVEIAAGRMKASDSGWFNGDIRMLLESKGGNRLHVAGVDGTTSEGRTEAECEGRRVAMRMVRFLRQQPGLGALRLTYMAPEIGVRETVSIRARTCVRVDDYLAGRVYADAICYSHYPIDIHTADGLIFQPLEPGVVPTLPLGALLPENGRNIIVAGRCAAGDQRSHSAFRVQAPCMAMGQAAGAAAALAVRLGVPVADVPLDALRALLREHGAIVPEPAATTTTSRA
jgi:hypothetical protein